MAHTFGDFEILSCPVYQLLSMIPCRLYIMLVSRRLLPSPLRLMLPSQQALSPTFQLLLLPLSANFFQPYLTSPVLVDNSFDALKDLFPRVSHSIGLYLHFWVLLIFAGYFGFLSGLCSGTHLVSCGASSWTHGWGVLVCP